MIRRFSAFAPWARIVIIACLVVLAYFLVTSAWSGIKNAIFGDPEVQRERGGRVVAEEQTAAEANIADQTIEHVRERDVYREQVRVVVREGQERVNAADHGQPMDPAIDAAVAAGLCGVHHSLCRGTAPADVQPVREPLPRAD